MPSLSIFNNNTAKKHGRRRRRTVGEMRITKEQIQDSAYPNGEAQSLLPHIEDFSSLSGSEGDAAKV